MSEFPRDPKAIADLFLKKVLDRMEANRETTKRLTEKFGYVVDEAALFPQIPQTKSAKA